MKNITIRDSGNKEVLEAYFLNHEGQPYNLENKTVTFMENKDGDKFVSDPNVQIVNATAGFVRYTLQSQVHSAPGIAWFEINDNSGLVDSTGNFNIRVENGLRATADNTTYIAALEKLKQQMETLIQQADGELKTELQRAEQQLNQELQNFRNQYNSLSADFQNQFKNAQNARQQDYNNQKNAINQDWTNNKNSIWEQWNNDKANIDKQAQDTVQAIKDNAKQVLDKDQANWNAKQTQWDSTFSAIVKEWQVKTNSLNATVQDLTNKFNTIIGQVSDLMNNKLPTINAKADAVQEKVNALRASLSQIDWTTFARRTDNSGGVNLLANTAIFRGFNNGGNSGQGTGFSIDQKKYYIKDPGSNEIKTKVFHVYAHDTQHAPVYFGQDFTLPAGTWTLSFLVRHNGKSNEKIHLNFYTDDSANHNWYPLGSTADIDNVWRKHQITFTTSKTTFEQNPRVHLPNETPIPGGSIYFANFKLEAGSIATDWCQSYLDFDRLDGRHDSVDAPDFNNLTSTGIYLITQPEHGQNYPVANWGLLKVDNAHDSRIEQNYYEDANAAHIWHRQCIDGTWKPWKQIPNSDDVLSVSGGNMNKGSWITWNGSDSNSAKDGHLGGIQWVGATDYIKVFGDNNGADNLDLAIQLGDDNSNHISFRDKDGAERAAITADGQFTGRTNWANVMNTGINNPALFRHVTNSNTWNDIIGQNNGLAALASFRDDSNGSGATIGNHSAGIVFGGGDTKGILNVDWDPNHACARIIGGNGSNPVWHKDIAWKDDLKVKVVKSYDIEKNKAAGPNTMDVQTPWLVDQVALATFANAHRDVRNHTDFRYPTDITSNTAINLNSDPYLNDGIYRIDNCAIINGPWDQNGRHWFYLRTVQRGESSINQFIIAHNELWFRGASKSDNQYPAWQKLATTNTVQDLSDRLSGFMQTQSLFQRRVDYESPSGTITNDTVDFNNYRETGILKVVNCLIQNGPYKSENRHSVFLKITNLDGQTQYQTVYEGDNLYGRKLYNGSGQWHKYTNTPI